MQDNDQLEKIARALARIADQLENQNHWLQQLNFTIEQLREIHRGLQARKIWVFWR